MATVQKSAARVGKFRKAADSAPPPVTADVREPGDVSEGIRKALASIPIPQPFDASAARSFLHAASDSTQRHPTKRIGTDGDGGLRVDTSGDEGGALTTIQPATTVGQLQHQISLLIGAFKEAEGREPNHDDDGFWVAYRRLVEAYGGVELGSAQRATEPLNADSPVRKAIRTALAKQRRRCDRCGKVIPYEVENEGFTGVLCDECRSDE